MTKRNRKCQPSWIVNWLTLDPLGISVLNLLLVRPSERLCHLSAVLDDERNEIKEYAVLLL